MWVGGERFPAIAMPMALEDAVGALRDYATRNPRAFQMLAKLMLREVGEDTYENCRQLAGAVPLVQLERGGI